MKEYIIFLLLLINSASAQIVFEKTFESNDNQSGYSVQQTFDGGYIVAGQNLNFPNTQLLVLIRTDSLGDTLWTRSFEGATFDLLALSVQQTSDSGFVVCGRRGDGSGNTLFLIKTDPYGNLIWTKKYSSPLELVGGSMKQTPDSGMILCGNTKSLSGTPQLFVIKTNSQGDILWSRLYFTFYSEGSSINVTKDNNYVISGQASSEPFILKIDLNGNIAFLKQYFMVGYETRILATNDGGFLLTGASNPSIDNDAFLLKTDSLGNIIWLKLFDGPLSYNDWGNTIIETKDSSYLLSIESGSHVSPLPQLLIIKINRNGTILWSRLFDGINSSGCYFDAGMCQTSDEGFIITGHRTSSTTGLSEIYLVKTDSLGNTGCNVVNPPVIDTFITCTVSSPATSLYPFQLTVDTLALTYKSNQIIHDLCGPANINHNNFILQQQVKLYPMPASGYFEVSAEADEIISLEIFNLIGEKIFALLNEDTSSKISIDSSDFPAGVYFIIVQLSDGEMQSTKFTVVR